MESPGMSDFRASPDGIHEILKAPGSVLDYSIDWSQWLQSDETISTADWSIPDGLTQTSEAQSASLVTTWLSGGAAGADYLVSVTITTSASPARTDTRSFRLLCRAR